ncbi:MAG: hypothetical protein JRH11_04070 [Deltaproteobacteria bacterium]|nr:hypothetical protein [Deltaproteobacteria bacterium]
MRASVCLLPCLLFASGCFLDHGAPDGRDPAGVARTGPSVTGICSLSAAAIYPKSLTLYRMADCHEATPVDACDVAGPEWPMDGAPIIEVSTSSVTEPDEGPSCDTVARPVGTATCDLPIESVGSFLVRIDARDELMLHIPYDSSVGASCWTFGGECETGAGPTFGLPSRISAGEAQVFDVAMLMDLDTPRPDACVVTIEDGGTMGPTETPRVLIRMRDAEETADCVGIGRRVRCLLPPLEAGEYVIDAPDGEARTLSVG